MDEFSEETCDKEPEEILKEESTTVNTVEVISFESICRICAKTSDHLIPIYEGEGVEYQLELKIKQYFPFEIIQTETMPSNCCYQCASTIIAWNQLIERSIEADSRLKALLLENTRIDDGSDEDTKDDCASAIVETLEPENSSSQDDRIVHTASADHIAFEETETKYTVEYLNHSPSIPDETLPSDDETIKSETKSLDGTDDENYESECDSCIEAREDKTYFCVFCEEVLELKDIPKHKATKHPKLLKNTKINKEEIKHAKVVIDKRIYYQCEECGKNLHSPYTYLWHRRIHTGERPFVCDLCGKQFRVSQGLARHLKETHAGVKNFACDLCGRKFSTRRNVEEHRRIHTNERPYVCDLCGKAFKQKASLFIHNRSHSSTFPFKCTYCNLGFRSRAPMLVHMTRHTGEKPYACDICGRTFRIKYEVKRHLVIHSEEKPFTCTQCGISFRQIRYLKNHNKTKHNNRPVAE